jgi:hypothetical protein
MRERTSAKDRRVQQRILKLLLDAKADINRQSKPVPPAARAHLENPFFEQPNCTKRLG